MDKRKIDRNIKENKRKQRGIAHETGKSNTLYKLFVKWIVRKQCGSSL